MKTTCDLTRRCITAIAVVAFACLGQGTLAETNNTVKDKPETLSYGSRAGMEITILSKAGIGTKRSVIKAERTEQNVSAYCRDYMGDASRACIDQQMKDTGLSKTITANCATGEFTTFYSQNLKFAIATAADGSFEARIIDLASGQALDGTAASGFSYDMEQFAALCPQAAALASSGQRIARMEKFPTRKSVMARGAGVVPGAVICSDLETVNLLFKLYSQAWGEQRQDEMAKGAFRRISGPPMAYPNFAAFGCALVPPGTRMKVETERPVPLVSVTLPDGTMVRGVTFAFMFDSEGERRR